MANAEAQTTVPMVLRVEEIEGKGRGLVAAQHLKAGQIIIQDSPILVYSAFPLQPHPDSASSPSSFRYCAHCFRNLSASSTVVICPSCSSPYDASFCSPKCQSLSHASTHTPWVCQAINHLRNCAQLVNQQSEELQVQARYLVAAYNLAVVSPSGFQTLLSLDGGQPAHNGADAAASAFLHSLVCLLPLPQGLAAPSLELTAALLVKDRRNAFGLMEPFSESKERSVRAYAIYPNVSFFNHDCLPNACRFDYVDADVARNADIVVRMIHEVPQGREVCLSYFPVNLRYLERQRRLLEEYGFTCSCDRCKVEAYWSDKEDDGEEGVDEAMDEEEGADDRNMMGSDMEEAGSESELRVDDNDGDDNFPHAYFFLRYMCNRENCGGTLAPVPPSGSTGPNIMECNVCGTLKSEAEIAQ